MEVLLHKINYFVFALILFSFSENMNAASININGAVTYNNGTHVGADITIKNGGTFTINSDAQLNSIIVNSGGVLIVNSPYTLTVGVSTNAATTQVVDFQNNSIVTINAGASLIVYGLLNNSNNSTGISFDGTVSVIGNVTGGNGSTIVGTGTLSATGTIITANSGTIFGSAGDCGSAPCNGGNLCSFTSSISSNQTVCSNVLPATITSVTTGASSPTYQWQSSIISGGGFADISGATNSTFSFSAPLSQTTYYRLKVKSTCTVITNQITVTVNSLPVITSQPTNQLDCEGASVSFSVVASGATTYTWKYKLPGGSFAAIPLTNVTYPAVGKITLANVGSAQFPDGTQFQVIVFNGTCSVSSSIATLSVNEITGITGSPSVTQCYGTNYALTASVSVTALPNVVSYQWKKSVASGVWNVISNGGAYSGATTASLVITGGTPSESAEYRIYITFNNTTTQCSVDSSTRTRQITFLPQLTTPLTSITQPTCTTATGTIAVTVQSASDTYSFDNGLNYQAGNVKSGLAAGNYNVIIKNIAGCVSSTTGTTLASAITTWSGSWSDGVPTINQKIIFNSSYNSTGDLSACSCYVSAAANVIVNSGHTLTVVNEVNVTSPGTLTFEDTASLVQLNNVSNVGNITYKRLTTPISKFDYTYWSSPVSPQTLYNVSPNTSADKFLSFDAVADVWKQESSSTVMAKGIGYIIRGPQNFTAPLPPGPYQASFIGVPNNGNVTVSITPSVEASYLLGNPYPSALDANAFLTANSGVLDGTIYFWTHNTPITGNLYSLGDYASYNLVGGVATSAVNTGVSSNVPSGKIASGQAFFATSIAPGTVVFDNSMRVGGGGIVGNNSQFFKFNTKSKIATSTEKNRVWLNLYNNQGVFKQALVGYVTGATNDYDNGYDGETFDGNEFLDFYSISQDKNLVIQGRSLPFDETDKVPLGYRSSIVGDFTIAVDQTDGLFVNQDVFIEDKNTKIVKNLKEGAYTFATVEGTFNDRFVLRYSYTDKTLGTVDLEKENNKVVVFVKNKQIKINSQEEMIDKILIFDISGKLIYKKVNINNNEMAILNLTSGEQTLLVKILLKNGQTVTRKIIY